MQSNDHNEISYKIIILGDSGVGKTNIIQRYAKGVFSLELKSTVGVEFSSKQLKIGDKTVNARIWDTAGQERFRAITNSFYRGAVGALLVYDITRKYTFESIGKWYKELKQYSDPNIVIMLIGNKNDLEESREVVMSEAESYSKVMEMAFIETSAKDSTNVEEAFQQLVQQIYNTQERVSREKPAQYNKGNQVQIMTQVVHSQQKPEKKACCV